MSATATATATTPAKVSDAPVSAPSRSSLLVSMLLQDASLLVIALGLLIAALALVVSLALGDEVPMLSSFLMIGAGMVVVGLLNAMLQYSNRKRNAAPGEIVLPPGHPPIPMDTLKNFVELDEDGKPKKRISKCPLGF